MMWRMMGTRTSSTSSTSRHTRSSRRTSSGSSTHDHVTSKSSSRHTSRSSRSTSSSRGGSLKSHVLLLSLAAVLLVLGTATSAAAGRVVTDEVAARSAALLGVPPERPVPSDDELDAMFNIPQLAAVLMAARADGEPPAGAKPLLSPQEVWARGRRGRPYDDAHTAAVLRHLSADELQALRRLCGRCLFHTLSHDVAVHGNGLEHTFTATGDIDAQWLRDSAVQLAIYLPRLAAKPFIRRIIEGAIRSQSYWILYDPYANAFNRDWRRVGSFSRDDRMVAKGAWIWEHKFELDSGAYFFNLLFNYYNQAGLFQPGVLFQSDPTIHDAVLLILRTWKTEQHHETDSPYLFASELPRGGKGSPTNCTGCVWGGFRPSDDGQRYGFNVPANMYAAGALARLLQLNAVTWQSAEVERRATQLLADIQGCLEQHAVTTTPEGDRVYAYEFDGLGNVLHSFDDPNLPSLLAMPLLGYPFDEEVYRATRARILSPFNKYYFSGRVFTGLGSPHTPDRYIWPLAHMVDALTTEATPAGARHQAGLVRDLLAMQCGNKLMHESVDVDSSGDDPQHCTRPVFEWSNAMLTVMAEQLLDLDCDAAATEEQLRETVRREWDGSAGRGGGIAPSLLQYARLPEADIPHQP